MPNFKQHWQDVLRKNQGNHAVEVIASITEDGINEFLTKHHRFDSDRYTFAVKRRFRAHDTFPELELRLTATSPIRVEFPPFAGNGPTSQGDLGALFKPGDSWTPIAYEPGPNLRVPADANSPNIRVFCGGIRFWLQWDKRDGTGKWPAWEVPDITLAAEAHIELARAADATEPGRFALKIQPTKVKFGRANDSIYGQILRTIADRAQEDAALAKLLDETSERFDDLLLILLNVVSTEYAPRLVRDVEIPAFSIRNRPLYPALLDLSEKTVTAAASFDHSAFSESAGKFFDKSMVAFELAMEEDLAASGGDWAGLATLTVEGAGGKKEVRILEPEQVLARMPRTKAFLDRISLPLAVNAAVPMVAGVRNSLCAGVSQYFLRTLLNDAMKPKVEKHTDWIEAVAVKGRAGYWTHLHSPKVLITERNGQAEVTGALVVDIGGALEGCVKKVWDCSWSWECARLALFVEGAPEVTVRLDQGSGIVFGLQLGGSLTLGTNLPFPFNKVVELVGSLIWLGVKGIINILIGSVVLEIIPPTIRLPNQRTGLNLRDFTPFYFLRTPGDIVEDRNRFLGVSCGVEAVATS